MDDDIVREIHRLRRQCEMEPRIPEHWNELGHWYLLANETAKARECFEHVVELKPDADGYSSLGTAYLVEENLDSAAGSFENSIALDPTHLGATTGLGFVCFQRGDIDKAKQLLLKSVSEDATNPEVQFALAKIAVVEGDFAQSVERCAISLRHDPFDPVSTLLLMGDSLLSMGGLKECERAYSTAVLTDEKNISALTGLAQIHIFLGRERDAEVELARAIELDRTSPLPHVVWGNIWISRGKPEKARDAYKQALSLDPACADAAAGLGAVFLVLGSTSKARATARKGLSASPNHVDCLLVMAQTSELMKRFDECASLAERALQVNPKQWHAHLLWARAEIAMRRDAKTALEHLKLADQFSPPGQAKESAQKLLAAMEQARSG